MKEKNIKEAYDKIEISQAEKNKIFNNIMENRKKSFNWFPIVGFGALAAASFGLFMVLGNKSGEELSNKNSETETKTVEVTRNIKLENNYRKEIIVGAKEYLEANKIDLEKLEAGKEIVIESNDIVKKDDYKVCSGKLVIKRYNDDFSYTTDVKCNGEDKEDTGSKEFVIYSGVLGQVFEVDDYLAIESYNNITYKDVNVDGTIIKEMVDYDVNLTVIDREGNIVFNKLIESKFKDEYSMVSLKGVNKINDNYYVIVQIGNDLEFYPSGSIRKISNHYYGLVLDKDGKELGFNELVDTNGSIISVDNYIGCDGGTAYYTGYNLANNEHSIVKVSKDKVELIKYDAARDISELERQRNNNITSYYNGNYYGYSYVKSYGKEKYYSSKGLLALDKDAKSLWEINIEDDVVIHDVIVKNDLIYVYATSSNGDSSSITHYIYTYSLKGEKQDSVKINDITKFKFNTLEYYIDGSNIVLRLNYNNKDYHYVVLDSSLKNIKEVDIDSTDIDSNFSWSYLVYSRLNGDKVNTIYSVNKNIDGDNSILLVFNK